MARPPKTGLDYFSMDCWLDDKMKLIEAEFGLKGFAIVVKLWQWIYRNGYYCEWNKDIALLFASQEGSNCGADCVNEIVSACLRRDIFSKELFDEYHILTSRGVQKRYAEATVGRSRVEIKKEYLLITMSKNMVFEQKTPVSTQKTPVSTADNSQRKRKEKKGKENKEITELKVDVPIEIQSQFEAYFSMRKQIKKPLSQRATELALKKLQSLAPNDFIKQGAILDQSTFHCWQGLFPLRDEGGIDVNARTDQSKSFKPSRT